MKGTLFTTLRTMITAPGKYPLDYNLAPVIKSWIGLWH